MRKDFDKEYEEDEVRSILPPSELQSYRTMRNLNKLKNIERNYEREDDWN